MNELFKNASDIIKSASTDPLALTVFIIFVFAVLYYFYLIKSKRDGQSTALFLILLAFTILLIFILRPPPCWDGSRSNPCPPRCWDGLSNPCPPPPPSPPPPPPCWDGSRSNPCPKKPWVSTRGFGKDSQGRKAEFNIYVLTSEYSWEISTPSSTIPGKIRYNGELKDLSLLKGLLETKDMRRVLESADIIISFGTASCQGSRGEESRALERASLIQTVIKNINSNRIISPVYRKLNLGQFKSDNCGDPSATAFQRSIIVVGADIIKGNELVNVSQALRNFLENLERTEDALGTFKVGDYSQFDYLY